jgi:nicotinate (nicotinamide) nucleotide adenylyltransferase
LPEVQSFELELGSLKSLGICMDILRVKEVIHSIAHSEKPAIGFLRQTSGNGNRLGVFASSFNPITTAHIELMRQARERFALDETLALAGMTNADKSQYDCSLEDRLRMIELALQDTTQTSIGLSSHAFFVDMLDALETAYDAQTRLHFIVGFDTFERVLDPFDKYTKLYHRNFTDRNEALKSLLTRSRLIVAGRKGAKHQDVDKLASQLPVTLSDRITYLDFPDDLAEHSATQVRTRLRQRLSINEFVPDEVARYIQKRGLYG